MSKVNKFSVKVSGIITTEWNLEVFAETSDDAELIAKYLLHESYQQPGVGLVITDTKAAKLKDPNQTITVNQSIN